MMQPAGFTPRFLNKIKIGQGNYGVVYKAYDSQRDRVVAIKKLLINEFHQGVPATAIREIALLKDLNHPNIVRLFEVFSTADALCLIFEFMDSDLSVFMAKAQGRLSPPLIQNFMAQLLHGLRHCHSRRVMHRDLKPQNILVTNDGTIKLADFGLARTFCCSERPYTVEVVTLWYRAPEILLGYPSYSTPIDIWALGCIFAEMLRGGAALFQGMDETDQLEQIFRKRGTPNENTWPGWTQVKGGATFLQQWPEKDLDLFVPCVSPAALLLLSQMLTYPPSSRLSASEAMDHIYFQQTAVQ